MKKDFSKIDEALNTTSEVVDVTPVKEEKPKSISIEDITKDYEYTRANLYSLIEKGQETLNGIMELAEETQSPRAYEVAGQLLKSVADTTDKLLKLQKDLKDVNEESRGPTNVTNNAMFVGSTAELQKMLKQMSKNKQKSLVIELVAEEIKESPKEEVKEVEKKKGPLARLKDAAGDSEEHLAILSTFVRLGILVWSGGILTLAYIKLPPALGIPEQKLDPTFIASVFTGVLATFGVQTAKKNGDGTFKGVAGGGVSKADLEKLIAAAAQTAPSQTIRIEQAPIQSATVAPKKDDEPPVMPTI